jgi:prepilin-type N-terminal cleavage/methylation domain-containing protein
MSGYLVVAATKTKTGFTLVEVLIVIFVLAILTGLVINYVSGSQERSYFTRAKAEFTTFENALKLYVAKHNDYPADVSRGIPADLKEFVAKDSQNSEWPKAPYPDSVYDYDNWSIDDGDGNMVQTYQISIRFCPAGGPLNACKFPNEDWAKDFGVNSALYYCIEGLCRSSSSEAADYPGYCVNCPNNKAMGT